MGQFGNLVLTTKGLQLQTKAQAGIELAFTRVGFGDGQLTQGQNLVDLTNLINHKITSPITSINIIGDGTTRVRTTLTNKDLTQGFYLREIGLFAQDPDIGEILYAVANAGEYADFLPIGTGNTIVETTLDLITVVGNAGNVTAVINESLTYTTVADLNDAFDTVQQKTLKKIIGTFIASENNTTVFTINESDYNPEVDQCELSYKGITLTKDVNYTQSGAEITLLFPINLSEQINYNILKFINNSTIKADGSNLQDKSITSIKLSQDVQDKVNKVPMIRSQLAGLSSKVSDLTGITPQIAKISRFFLNSKAIVSNQSDSFYANCPNPPLGGVFNNLNSSSGSIIASTIDTPATCWALINLLKIYGENNDVATLNRAKLIGNYIVNSIINASFYGAIFRVMPNAYSYASGTGWTPVVSTIHVRTQYHAMWALLELYKVTGNVTYKNSAIDLMKTIGNVYNNIKVRATTQTEISSWMVGAIYNTMQTDGASPTPNMTFSWNVFNHNTADMLSKAIPLYIQQVGNASINDWEGTAFVPQSIINDFKTFIQYAYNNKNLTMTPTGLPYSFFEYEDTDAKVNNSYEPKPKNYDWITSNEFGDTWFVNDLTLWTILGIANLGLMDIATRYRNAFMKLQISSYPDKLLFHDRYNFDGTSLIDDQSISICATALLYAVDKTLGIVDDELHSVMNDTLLGYQIQSTNLNIDGSYRWDIADSAASIEVKATSEICYNSSFIVGGGVIDSITSQLAEQSTQLEDLEINKAEKTEVNSLANEKANQVDLVTERKRIDNLVQTSSSSFYEKCLSTDTGALPIVSSGATTGQINLASVTPVATGYVPMAGDYVRLVYGVASGSAELIDGRIGADGVLYTNIGISVRTQIAQLQSQLSYKRNILPINYTAGGYWNKDINNNLNLVANASYNCINSIPLVAGKTYTIGIVMGYYSWVKKTSDGTVTRLYDTPGVDESTYTITPLYDCTLWLSASNGKLPYVMVIENATSLPATYKVPNVIYDIYVKDRLIDNIDKISSITKDIISGSISCNIQNATLTTGYYWKFVSPNMTKVSYASYNTLEPIELKAGIPYTIGKVFGRWSWVYDQVAKTANYLDAVDQYLNYTITPTNDSLLYLTCNNTLPQVIKNAYEMPNDSIEYGIAIDSQIDGVNKKFVVGAGLQYTSLTQAIADAVKYPNSIVEVKGGTYDLYQEQGEDAYFNTFTYSDASPTFRGIVLKNNVHVKFSSDSKVVFNYTGSNTAVMQYYSPFNSAQGLGGFTLENLNLVASKCRYGVHDERGYTQGRYKNTYKNCKISLDNSANTAWQNYQCIGGGLGQSGYIEIDGCIFNSVISSPTNIVSYHNNGDTTPSKSNIYIKNSWFSDGGYARIGYYGNSTDLSEMVVTGCSYNHEPTISAEGSATLVNVKLTKYGNELRAV